MTSDNEFDTASQGPTDGPTQKPSVPPMAAKITPDQFVQRMKELAYGNDPEQSHIDADELMLEVLDSLGYGEGVAVFRDMDRWYA